MGRERPEGVIAFGCCLRLFDAFLEPGGGMSDPHKTTEIKVAGKGRSVAEGERKAIAGDRFTQDINLSKSGPSPSLGHLRIYPPSHLSCLLTLCIVFTDFEVGHSYPLSYPASFFVDSQIFVGSCQPFPRSRALCIIQIRVSFETFSVFSPPTNSVAVLVLPSCLFNLLFLLNSSLEPSLYFPSQ